MTDKIFELIDGKIRLSGKFAFEMFSVHGVPPEIFEEIATEWIDENKEKFGFICWTLRNKI